MARAEGAARRLFVEHFLEQFGAIDILVRRVEVEDVAGLQLEVYLGAYLVLVLSARAVIDRIPEGVVFVGNDERALELERGRRLGGDEALRDGRVRRLVLLQSVGADRPHHLLARQMEGARHPVDRGGDEMVRHVELQLELQRLDVAGVGAAGAVVHRTLG